MNEYLNAEINPIEALSQALLEAIGPNDPYPTPEEIAAYKWRKEQRLKYQDMVFTDSKEACL